MKLLIVLLVSFIGQRVFAWGEVSRFRTATLNTIENAQQKGLTEVQGVKLDELKDFVKDAPIYYNGHLTVTYGSRQCAAWQPGAKGSDEKGFILLNKQCADLPEDAIGALGVHETLGLSAGLDRNYEISTVIVNGQIPKSKFVDLSKNKLNNLQKSSTNGGSSGVGGGGDFDDLNFKLQGFKYLQNITDGYIDGIPVELLEVALQHMRAVPAIDANGMMEFSRRGFGLPQSTVFVAVGLYRSRDYANLGMVAYLAARSFLLHAPDEAGLTSSPEPDQDVGEIKTWEAPGLQQAVLLIPSEDGQSVMTWKNTALQKEMSAEAYQSLLRSEQARVQAILGNPEMQKLFRMYSDSIQLHFPH